MPVKSRIKLDWVIFDSPEEVEIYKAIKDWVLDKLTWHKEFKGIKLIEVHPEPIILYPSFKRWWETIRWRKYTPDFVIKLWKKIIHLEVKSLWTSKKPDYRLRKAIFLYLHWNELNFAELIKVKKWNFILNKYYND